MQNRKYLVTIMVEGPTNDPKHIHDSLAIQFCEEKVVDCLDYEVTHVFDVQEIPGDN